jgi:aspartate/methionine/tyrosine aminotransferase
MPFNLENNDKTTRIEVDSVLEEGVVSTLSSRGSESKRPLHRHLTSYNEALRNPCHAVNNPEGWVALCMAENKLAQNFLGDRCSRLTENLFIDRLEECFNYASFQGLPAVREGVAQFLEHFFWRKDAEATAVLNNEDIIHPNHICLAAGASAILVHLFWALAEANDAVLIPAPYYATFEYKMGAISKCIPVPVYMKDCTQGPTVEELQAAFSDAEQKGFTVKILLITNPNNPLGVIYSSDVILNAINWARSQMVHTVVDEIYALSLHYPNSGHRFVSVIQLLNNSLGNDVHFVWGLSKDFGCSGFRVGVLYSQNKWLLQSMSNLKTFPSVSQPMQLLTLGLLQDTAFVTDYLEYSRRCIVQNKAICTSKLQQLGIPYVDANAGIFLYVDFSSLLSSQQDNAVTDFESKLGTLMEKMIRVVMTPGSCQRDCRPGWFRICYAFVNPEVLGIAMERIEYFLLRLRASADWSSDLTLLGSISTTP